MFINTKHTFYPIGQGGFFSQRIASNNEVLTIVYDCGSDNIEFLKNQVKHAGLSKIDYLIISHFHKDHINGIETLKKHSKEIKNVIIPKLDHNEIVLLVASGQSLPQITLAPETFFPESKIIRVDTIEEGTTEINSDSIENRISHNTIIQLISQFKAKSIVWRLKFYVSDKRFDLKKLNSYEKKILEETKTISDYNKNKKKLTAIYKKVSKTKVNFTSMSMASYSGDTSFYFNYETPTFLLNGDIYLNNEREIQKYLLHFSHLTTRNICFQVPHHGSNYNLLRPLNELFIRKAIINAGYSNKYGHPSGTILRMLKDSNIKPNVITEFDKALVINHSFII